MKNYCDYNAGYEPEAHEHADLIEPDPIMVAEYDWDTAPESLKAHFPGADEEESE